LKERAAAGITSGFPIEILGVIRKLETILEEGARREKAIQSQEDEREAAALENFKKEYIAKKHSTLILWGSTFGIALFLVYVANKIFGVYVAGIMFLIAAAFIGYLILKPEEFHDMLNGSLEKNSDYLQQRARIIESLPQRSEQFYIPTLKLLHEEALEKNQFAANAEIVFERFCLSYLLPYRQYKELKQAGLSEDEIQNRIDAEFFQPKRDLISGEVKSDSSSETYLESRKRFWDLLRQNDLFEEFIIAFDKWTQKGI
jgi:hypothetical protein